MKTFMQTLRESRLSEEIPVNPDSMSQQSPSGFDYMDDEQSFDDINDLQDAAASNPHLMRAKQNGDYYFQMSKEQLNPDRAEVFLRIAKKYYDVARFVANLDLNDLSEATIVDESTSFGLRVPNTNQSKEEAAYADLISKLKGAQGNIAELKRLKADAENRKDSRGAMMADRILTHYEGLVSSVKFQIATGNFSSSVKSKSRFSGVDTQFEGVTHAKNKKSLKELSTKKKTKLPEETLKEFAVAPEDQQVMQLQKKIQNLQAALVVAQQQLNTVNGKKLQRTKQLQQKAVNNKSPNPMGSGI